jgi:hypothetical protein
LIAGARKLLVLSTIQKLFERKATKETKLCFLSFASFAFVSCPRLAAEDGQPNGRRISREGAKTQRGGVETEPARSFFCRSQTG